MDLLNRKTYKGDLPLRLMPNQIYQFGSNTQGRHGLGSALIARINHGAIYGKSKGRQGNSYAIITKDLSKKPYKSYPIDKITEQIADFYLYALKHEELEFVVAYTTRPNLNGYSTSQMASMYLSAVNLAGLTDIPVNIVFNDQFINVMDDEQHKN